MNQEPVIRVFIESTTARENNERDLGLTQYRQFISFLEQSVSSLAEGDLTARAVLDSFDLYLSSPHAWFPSIPLHVHSWQETNSCTWCMIRVSDRTWWNCSFFMLKLHIKIIASWYLRENLLRTNRQIEDFIRNHEIKHQKGLEYIEKKKLEI